MPRSASTYVTCIIYYTVSTRGCLLLSFIWCLSEYIYRPLETYCHLPLSLKFLSSPLLLSPTDLVSTSQVRTQSGPYSTSRMWWAGGNLRGRCETESDERRLEGRWRREHRYSIVQYTTVQYRNRFEIFMQFDIIWLCDHSLNRLNKFCTSLFSTIHHSLWTIVWVIRICFDKILILYCNWLNSFLMFKFLYPSGVHHISSN